MTSSASCARVRSHRGSRKHSLRTPQSRKPRRRPPAAMARYCHVVYDGVIGPWFLPTFVDTSTLERVHYAVLLPPLEVCLRRVRVRTGHGFTDLVRRRTHVARLSARGQWIDATCSARSPPQPNSQTASSSAQGRHDCRRKGPSDPRRPLAEPRPDASSRLRSACRRRSSTQREKSAVGGPRSFAPRADQRSPPCQARALWAFQPA